MLRVTATAVYARYDAPAFDQSAMDGIAFCAGGHVQLRVVGTVAAGDAPQTEPLAEGCAVRIMTGAPLPVGCDTVVPVERLQFEGDQVTIQETYKTGQHVRKRAENLACGDLLFEAGTVVDAAVLGALAAQGIGELRVLPPLRVRHYSYRKGFCYCPYAKHKLK